MVTPCTAPVCPLTLIAWRLGALTLSELWWRYISVGGHHPQTALSAYLDGRATWPDTEHNVLAQTLNEGLWRLSIPSLAPHREHEHAAPPRATDGGPSDRGR